MGYHDFSPRKLRGRRVLQKGPAYQCAKRALPAEILWALKKVGLLGWFWGPSLFTLGLSRSIISSMPCHLQAICTWILGTDRLLARPSSHFEWNLETCLTSAALLRSAAIRADVRSRLDARDWHGTRQGLCRGQSGVGSFQRWLASWGVFHH